MFSKSLSQDCTLYVQGYGDVLPPALPMFGLSAPEHGQAYVTACDDVHQRCGEAAITVHKFCACSLAYFEIDVAIKGNKTLGREKGRTTYAGAMTRGAAAEVESTVKAGHTAPWGHYQNMQII